MFCKSMKAFLVGLAGLFLSAMGALALAEGVTLSLTINNVKSTNGSVFIAVYDSKDTFLGESKVLSERIWLKDNVDQGQVKTELKLMPGEYAIMVFHDDNNNDKLDTNFIGIPKEPGGFSNGHVPKFGPPRFSAARFSLTAEGGIQTITLN